MARGASLLGSSWSVAIDPARRDGRIVAEAADEERTAKPVALPGSLAPALTEALRRGGIESLYTHQLAAYEAAASSDVVGTSGTRDCSGCIGAWSAVSVSWTVQDG